MFGLKRRRLPADKRPALVPDERILAWGGGAGDDVVVATTFGIWLPGATDRLGWHEIHKATWSGRQLAIIPAREVERTDGYAVMEDQPTVVHPLLDPDDVPEQVRARVNRSVAYTSHHPLPYGGGVRVVARRVAGVNGLRWTVRYDPDTDRTSPEVAAITAELVARARAESTPSDL